MQLLNLACNGCRLPEPFINIDILRTQLLPGTPERTNLDAESNYVEADLLNGIPFPAESCDGVLASHFIEHLDAQESVQLIADVKRVLIPGGIFVVSVPDTAHFRRVYPLDNHVNSMDLFGETINCWQIGKNIIGPFEKFFDYALFHHEHKQILTEDSLWALLVKGGFPLPYSSFDDVLDDTTNRLRQALNRPKFSLVMWCRK